MPFYKPTASACFSLALITSLSFLSACSSDGDDEPIVEAPEDLFINEVYAAGDDWIELYNASDATKDVGNYFIYDDASAKYKLPAGTTVPAKGFLVIFCDDGATGLHTNFKLTSDGETVSLENTSGQLVDYVTFPKLDNGQVYGRFPDGTDSWLVSGKSSAGASNDEANAPAITSVKRVPLVPGLSDAVTIQAELTNTATLASVKLFYRFNNAAYWETAMSANGGIYAATIPAQHATGRVDYYVEARSTEGVVSRKPFDAPDDEYKYLLNTDALPLLYINEFMALNTSCCPDTGSGTEEFDDWIEIYNAGLEAVDVGGMYLSDDKDDPFKFKIPDNEPAATTIQPGGYLVFWADEQQEQGSLHTSFKLSTDGEDVGIYYVDGRTIHAYTFAAQAENKSAGLTADGGNTWTTFSSPTPGASNE